MDIQHYMQTLGRQARAASRVLAAASTAAKNAALLAMAAEIRARRAELLAANAQDLDAARAAGLEPALIDRLTLDEKGVEAMAAGLEQVAALPDPVGEMTDIKRRPSGIALGKNIGRRFYVEIVTDGRGYSATQLEFRVTNWLSLLATVSTIGRQSAVAKISRDY